MLGQRANHPAAPECPLPAAAAHGALAALIVLAVA